MVRRTLKNSVSSIYLIQRSVTEFVSLRYLLISHILKMKPTNFTVAGFDKKKITLSFCMKIVLLEIHLSRNVDHTTLSLTVTP